MFLACCNTELYCGQAWGKLFEVALNINHISADHSGGNKWADDRWLPDSLTSPAMVEELQEGCRGVEKTPVSSSLDNRDRYWMVRNAFSKLLHKNQNCSLWTCGISISAAPQAPQEKLLHEAHHHQCPRRSAGCLRGSRCVTGKHRTRLTALVTAG